jgi:alkanesulfonate monooxygenase SsuD/methylene tetrahydromethanopterin reductase-like flavin-dependent oxidoreductase (luciferase family)
MAADKIGVVCPVGNLSATDAAAMVRRAEKLGYASCSISELVVGSDPFAIASFLLSQTEPIKAGLGVAIICKRHPATMLNAERTLAGLFDNRFTLTTGATHKPFINCDGMHYEQPSATCASTWRR